MSISLEVTQPIVAQEYGEITIKVTNDKNFQEAATQVYMNTEGPVDGDRGTNETGRLAFIPVANEGYSLSSIPAGQTTSLVFAAKGVDAAAGAYYRATAWVKWPDGTLEYAQDAIFIQAQPEIYAAVGAVSLVQSKLLELYNQAKEEGLKVSQESGGLPSTGRDPISTGLHPQTLQWALHLTGAGSQLGAQASKADPETVANKTGDGTTGTTGRGTKPPEEPTAEEPPAEEPTGEEPTGQEPPAP